MKNLFGEEEIDVKSEVKISNKGNKNQSKNQLSFNKLIARIQKLEGFISSENLKFDKFLQFYQKEIFLKQIELANSKINCAFTFDEFTNKAKLSKKQTTKVKESIVLLFDEAFQFLEPTEEQEALFDKWADVSYKDDILSQQEFQKNMFSTFMSDMFGTDFGANDLDIDNPENVSQFEEKIKNHFEEKSNSKNKAKKKTKKQLEKENQLKAEELAQNKSLRSIYISLTKVLHPDTETDDVLKKEKEEIMKTVTLAYENKDLSTLLKLEMEWVFKTNENFEKLADDKLKIYISVLKERVSELEQEKFMMYRNPRLESVSEYLDCKEDRGIYLMGNERREIEFLINNFNLQIINHEKVKSKSEIIDLIDVFHEVYCDDVNDFEMVNEGFYF